MIKHLFNSLFWKGLNILSSMVTGILLARFLSISDRGEYVIFISVIALYSVIINLGIPESLVYLLQKDKKNSSFYLKIGLLVPVLVLVLVILIYYFFKSFEINIFYFDNESFLYLTLLCVLLVAYNILFRHIILKENRIPLYNFLSSFELILIPFILFIFYKLDKFTLYNIILIFISISVLSFLIHIFFTRKSIKELLSHNETQFTITNIRKLFAFAFPLFFLGISGIFSTRLNLFLLEYFHDFKNVGYYSVAMILPNLILVIPNQVSVLLYPVASSINNDDQLTSYGIDILKSIIFFLFFFILASSLVIPYIIPAFYGEKYIVVIPTIYIIIVGVFFGGINAVLMNLLISKGLPKVLLYNAIITITGIFIFSFLVHYYSYIGTALTYTIVSLICCAYSFYQYKKTSKIKFSSLLIRKDDLTQLYKKVLNVIKKDEN